MWASNSLLLGEKVGVGSSLPIVWLCAKGGVYGECISAFSYPFHWEYFLICLLYRIHSASCWISFTGNCSTCSLWCVTGKKGAQEIPRSLSLTETSSIHSFLMWLPVIACGTNLFTFGHVFHLIRYNSVWQRSEKLVSMSINPRILDKTTEVGELWKWLNKLSS